MATARAHLDVGGHEIDVCYTEHGAGRVLLAIHGWTLDHRAQEMSLEPLFADRHGWRRLYVDLPGHGTTHAPDWVRTHDDVADAVAAFVDAVAPGARICVAGLSYGSVVAQMLVERLRDRTGGVALTAAPTGDARLPAFAVRHLDPEFVGALEPSEQHQLEFVVWQSPGVLAAVRARFESGAELCDREFLDRLGWDGRVSRLAQPFDGPALIVAGRFDDWCGYRGAFELLDDYPYATFAVLDGSGHGLTVERERLYRALVSDWLDRVEAA